MKPRPTDDDPRRLEGEAFIQNQKEIRLRTALETAQSEMIAHDRNIPHPFKINDEIYLSTNHLNVAYGNSAPVTYLRAEDTNEDGEEQEEKEGTKSRKLQHPYFGPFRILEMVGKNAAKLDIPPAW